MLIKVSITIKEETMKKESELFCNAIQESAKEVMSKCGYKTLGSKEPHQVLGASLDAKHITNKEMQWRFCRYVTTAPSASSRFAES